MALVYKITNRINNLIYIGATRTRFNKRISSHKCEHFKNKAFMYEEMRKHGFDNFIFEIIEECNSENLFDREEFYIKKLNSLYPHGYNMMSSHKIGAYQVELSKTKKRESQLKRWSSLESRDEQSLRMKEMFRDDEIKKNHLKAIQVSKYKRAKAVIGTNLETKETKEFLSLKDAANYVGGDHSKVFLCCNGKRNKHKGWSFIYKT